MLAVGTAEVGPLSELGLVGEKESRWGRVEFGDKKGTRHGARRKQMGGDSDAGSMFCFSKVGEDREFLKKRKKRK